MNTTEHSLNYGTSRIDYQLQRDNRKLLQISVQPDRSVIVKAPLDATDETIKQCIRKRAAWILRQLRYFRQFEPYTPPRRYVAGETHLYLGRAYRLKLNPELNQKVHLKDGWFHIPVERDDSERARRLLQSWYRQQARRILPPLLDQQWNRMELGDQPKPRLMIRNMRTRWGSLSASGRLTMNLSLLRAPMICIEYVLVHELCHLQHQHHDRDFYKLLTRSMPDWQERKQRLERALA